MSTSTADDIAPASTLSDGPPLDAAQRLGLARFRLGPDAPAWLTETLAFARDEVARLTRERDEAREIIEGRTTAPTGEEVTRHDATGGRWRTRYVIGEAALSRDTMSAADVDRVMRLMRPQHIYAWWPLDSHGRPCAWPTVTP